MAREDGPSINIFRTRSEPAFGRGAAKARVVSFPANHRGRRRRTGLCLPARRGPRPFGPKVFMTSPKNARSSKRSPQTVQPPLGSRRGLLSLTCIRSEERAGDEDLLAAVLRRSEAPSGAGMRRRKPSFRLKAASTARGKFALTSSHALKRTCLG